MNQAFPINEESLSLLRSTLPEIENEKRAAHSVSVEKECRYFAKQTALSEEDTLMLQAAALLHDCTHLLSLDAHRALLLSGGYSDADADAFLKYPKTVHQVTAPIYIRAKFPAFAEEEILSAVGCHTTGKPGMTLLDILLCLADYTEETRPYEECRAMRKRLHEALERANGIDERKALFSEAMLSYLSATIRHIAAGHKGDLDPMTLAAREDLIGKCKKEL